MKLYNLADTRHEVDAALSLRHVSAVIVATCQHGSENSRLRNAGLSELPNAIQVVVSLPFDACKRSRNFRRSLAGSIAAWSNANLRLSLCPATKAADTAERIYFEILVPWLYARGWSPFGIHSYRKFQSLMDDRAWVAAVHQDQRIVGGGILTDKQCTNEAALAGCTREGSRLTGQVYGLHPQLGDIRRAFLFYLMHAAAEREFVSLSCGKDLPWMQEAYARVFAEKLSWADAFIVSGHDPIYWADFANAGEPIIVCRRKGAQIEIAAPPELSSVADLVRKRIVRIEA